MQFSQNGFWGRGLYFAAKSAYSYHYSHRPNDDSSVSERGAGKSDEVEMFLAKLLCGDEIFMDRDESDAKAAECKELKVPPLNPATNKKFNSVTGNTAGSQVVRNIRSPPFSCIIRSPLFSCIISSYHHIIKSSFPMRRHSNTPTN